jgi:excisionase family DNA binding protein
MSNGNPANPAVGVCTSASPPPDRRRPDRQHLQPEGRRMLTLREVAIHLSCRVETVRKLIRLGELRAVKLGPRMTRVPERSLCAFLDR